MAPVIRPIDAEPGGPLVSVVIATYNRPDVLRHTIASVRGQTVEDWEMLVVGDGCEPETAAAVAECGDARIRYIHLPINFGEQSGPNNIGLSEARGHYVAYLNHDDLWFPDHLESCIRWIEADRGDIVIARGVSIWEPDSPNDPLRGNLFGIGVGGRYDPVITYAPASMLLFRRDILSRVGRWRAAAECYAESSQDWLFRAWRMGIRVVTMPHLTVVLLQSGARVRAYVEKRMDEHGPLLVAMAEPDRLRSRLLALAAVPWHQTGWRLVLQRLIAAIGLSPRMLRFWREGFRRGGLIEMLAQRRGLAPPPKREPDVTGLRELYERRLGAATPAPPGAIAPAPPDRDP